MPYDPVETRLVSCRRSRCWRLDLRARLVARRRAVAHAQNANRVFELRTYTAPDGKLPELQARFRNHTMRIFEKHGMKNVGYWVPQDAPTKDNTLIYIISHESREAAKKSWAASAPIRNGRRWPRNRRSTARSSPASRRCTWTPTDYSPIK